MVFSDVDLRRIWPDSPHIQAASIDLHLGDMLKAWPTWALRDPRMDQSDIWYRLPLRPAWDYVSEGEDNAPAWVLHPGVRYLATTRERVKMPDDCAGQLSARSSWARDGLNVLAGPAGWIDPGFLGPIVLELSVVGSDLVIWPGASVCQLVVHRLETPAERPYGHPGRQSKYQDLTGVTPSRTHLEVIR